ncbi:MAG: hypothetical protein JWP89_2633 [Schlesneria sp.]|nr:hypothetical protein [Schlesneria sp.]
MIKRFKINHGLFLKSANRLLTPNTNYSTDDAEQQKELLEVFGEAAEEIVSTPIKAKVETKPEEKTVNPDDDITLAKGVGAATATKLEAKGITTFSGLKAAMTDKAREEEMKELLGTAYTKVMENFQEKTNSPEVK